MKDWLVRCREGVLSFWFFAIALVVCIGLVAVYLYRLKIGVELSDEPNDWSVFGTYIGGVLGPLVSFVTLLAVLKTVYLQRELLDAQAKEFERMNILQQQTFEASLSQMTSAASDARMLQVSASQDTAIKVIDQHLSIYERKMTRQSEILFKLLDRHKTHQTDEATEQTQKLFNSTLERRDVSRVAIDKLAELSTAMAVSEYFNSDQVRKELLRGLDDIKNGAKEESEDMQLN